MKIKENDTEQLAKTAHQNLYRFAGKSRKTRKFDENVILSKLSNFGQASLFWFPERSLSCRVKPKCPPDPLKFLPYMFKVKAITRTNAGQPGQKPVVPEITNGNLSISLDLDVVFCVSYLEKKQKPIWIFWP